MIGEFLKGVTCPLHTLADRDERLAWYDRQTAHSKQPITQTELAFFYCQRQLLNEVLADLKERFRKGAGVEPGDYSLKKVSGKLDVVRDKGVRGQLMPPVE